MKLRQLGVLVALVMGLAPILAGRAGQGAKPADTQYFGGKVMPLAEVLARRGVKLDVDAAKHWMALVADDGKVYPLIKDPGSRMFFQDKTLLNRPMRLTGRLLPETRLLQVVNVHSIKEGKLYEVYYWCDICTIKGYEKVICECCGGPMELREALVK